jgi:hypothetical protein
MNVSIKNRGSFHAKNLKCHHGDCASLALSDSDIFRFVIPTKVGIQCL